MDPVTPTSAAPASAAPAGPAAPLIPAATVVPLRDGASGLETLMLRRNSKLEFAGGMWVWPGGRIDPDDYPDATPTTDPDALAAAARTAAVREAGEEAGIVVDPDTLVWFSHWTPPPIAPKRFGTWFFVAPAPAGEVTIDGGEIHDHAWMAPGDAMTKRNALEIELSPPTWITLEQLARFSSVAEAMTELSARPPSTSPPGSPLSTVAPWPSTTATRATTTRRLIAPAVATACGCSTPDGATSAQPDSPTGSTAPGGVCLVVPVVCTTPISSVVTSVVTHPPSERAW